MPIPYFFVLKYDFSSVKFSTKNGNTYVAHVSNIGQGLGVGGVSLLQIREDVSGHQSIIANIHSNSP